MTPTTEHFVDKHGEHPRKRTRSGEEIVISGMSGIFPSSDSVQEFGDNLYNKVDMVTSDHSRWNNVHPEIPKHLGVVNGMSRFDAQFFRVHYKQACTMEPMCRKLLEHAYSAIYDSGINPLHLKGKKVGVFVGTTFSESERNLFYEIIEKNGFGISGCNRSMYANRISYWIDGNGPSFSLDLACASSSACLEQAYKSINSGICDAAIVGGCNLCMHPNVSLNFRRAGFACLDGKTRCFDKNSDGYTRADTICAVFLQKAKVAKRIYSEVYFAKTTYSPSCELLLPIRKPDDIQQFYEGFYSKIDVSPNDVDYVEANGAAIPVADENEITAIGRVFGKNKPIKIGCVKSNMGSSEPASGLCSVIKMCLAYHNGRLPGNLHYEEPLDIPELRDNKVQVLTENINFNRGFSAVNSFSYSGANVHVLLKGHYKKKDTERYKSNIPYLILISGRQENCVQNILKKLKSDPLDPEQISLLNDIHEFDTSGHLGRGFSILDTNDQKETICLRENVEYYAENKQPVWFVYSGMGSQWATMGAELMRIPIFAAAIQRCHVVLEPKGIDIVKILTDPDKKIYDNILHSFVGIAAVQIGLTDILRELGVVPDNIIGHSVGELGCAYADGCFTAEEMILSAYSRGLVSVQTPFIRGSMAAIGLGYEQILPLCPPEIQVACHNSSESATISGPADVMKQFVSELTSKGIFAKEVPSSNIAFHSRYIAEAGPALFKCLKEIIKEPKARSDKWVSTSVPEEQWDHDKAKYSSAEYHTNNLLNPVLFEETSKLIPSEAVVIEIAPHGLLQAILKRSLSKCVHIPLTRRGAADPITFLLEAFGKMYQNGLNPKVNVLYPKIEYPVSTGTPFLSPLVEWEHSEQWPEARFDKIETRKAAIRDFVMSMHDDEYEYFKGHVRNGCNIFPEAAYLVLVWETLAMFEGMNYKDMSVVFKKVQFHQDVIIKHGIPLKLQIMIMKGSDKFEITHDNDIIVSGVISKLHAVDKQFRCLQEEEQQNKEFEKTRNHHEDNVWLCNEEIYTMMRLKGYDYTGKFQPLQSVSSTIDKGKIKWTDNWITYIDSIFQFNALARDHDGVSTPILIDTLKIDVKNNTNSELKDSFDIIRNNLYNFSRSGGIRIDGLEFKDEPKTITNEQTNIILTQKFVPDLITDVILPAKIALQVNLQTVSDNITDKFVQVANMVSENQSLSNELDRVSKEIVTHEFLITSNKVTNDKDWTNSLKRANLVVIDNILTDVEKVDKVRNSISKNAFVLTLEHNLTTLKLHNALSVIRATFIDKQTMLILLRKIDDDDNENIVYVPIVQDSKFSWIQRLKLELEKSRTIVLVSERQPFCGLLGMVRELRKENGNKIKLIVIQDCNVPSFSPDINIYKDQLEKKLAYNILIDGRWGGYYNISSGETMNTENFRLSCAIPNDLNTLKWIEIPQTPSSNNTVQVICAGTSDKDVKIRNKAVEKQGLGMDFCGVNKRGDSVMGIVSGGAIASSVEVDPDLQWPVPSHWALEDAATVPLPYAQAYYCLVIRYNLLKGQMLVLNAGATPFAQAAIAIATSLDCLIYVKVENMQQKEILLKLFPSLQGENVSCSFDLLRLKIHTTISSEESRNVIVNYYSGPSRQSSMSLVGNKLCTRFLDLSENDMKLNKDFGMYFLSRETHYVAVRFESIFHEINTHEKKRLQMLIAEGITTGVVRPLIRVVYDPSQVTSALRMAHSNKSTGRVLIQMNNLKSVMRNLTVSSSIQYSANSSYIVVCDDSALSIELADRLVKQGARNLILHTKSDSISGYLSTKIRSWKKLNVSVKMSSENLQSEERCSKFLLEGKKSGPVYGIFIVSKFEKTLDSWSSEDMLAKYNETALVISNLDRASRNFCKELKHFVVINYANTTAIDEYIASVTDGICRTRNYDGLPALVLRNGIIAEFSEMKNDTLQKAHPQSLKTVFNVLETSLKQDHDNIITYDIKNDDMFTTQFIERISSIFGVDNIDDLDENLKLSEIYLNEATCEEIKVAIEQVYKQSYAIENVKQFTIKNLKELGLVLSKGNTNNNFGLGTFFTYIDNDECFAAEPLVKMTTINNIDKSEDNLDPEATYLMLIPGFEGHNQIFTAMSERLKIGALTLQIGPDLANDSIPQIAAHIAKFIRNRIELKSKFYLLGYSFGVNVALELARIFENEGRVGVVYCLDSSPDFLRAQLDAHIGDLSDSQLQNAIIEHMYKLMIGENSTELKHEYKNKENWHEKVEYCSNQLRGLVKYSHQYKKCILNSAYKRILLAREYQPNFVLNSELILIKGVPHPNMKTNGLAEDFNLSKYTNRPVKIYDIDSDHASAHQDCKVSNIVNKLLDPQLLEEYRHTDQCYTYRVNLTNNMS